MIAPGKSAAGAAGPIGLLSGPSGGDGGFGMAATTLYQFSGMSDSSRRIFTCCMEHPRTRANTCESVNRRENLCRSFTLIRAGCKSASIRRFAGALAEVTYDVEWYPRQETGDRDGRVVPQARMVHGEPARTALQDR